MANLSARSHSIKKWTCVLVVLVAFQLLVNTFLGPLLGPMLLGLSIQFWMGYKTISYNCCNKQPDGCEELAPPLLPKDASKQPAAAGKSERLYYLDNLKVFLTVMVIVHHVTCMFVGGGWVWNFNSYTADNYSNYIKNFGEWLLTVDQSYFMCMFFFISGYFTPTSLDRKGRHAFLKDKFKRLGIPYVLVSIMWFPLCMFTSFLMIKNIGSESVNGENISDVYFFAAIPNPGPLWFVGWLCIFNTIYASVDHSEPKVMACPTPFRLFAMSVPMMVLQILVNVIGLGSFLFMPITIGSLPFDIMWFYGGCVAKRNKWLEAGTEGGLVEIMNRPWMRFSVYSVYLAVLAVGLLDAFDVLGDGAHVPVQVLLVTTSITLVAYVELDFFRTFFNFTGWKSKWLAENAYAAYVVHPMFVNIGAWLFLKTYEHSTGDDSIIFIGLNVTSSSEFVAEDGQGWLFGGWVMASVFATVTTWIAAAVVRAIPGVKSVL